MEVQPDLIAHVEKPTEQNGYNLFTALWNQTKRPDGLLVTDDIFCRGALRAILHLGVQVPEELHLITQANEGVALPFHLTVTRLELSPPEFARQACEMMLLRCRGKTPAQKQIDIPVRLVQREITDSSGFGLKQARLDSVLKEATSG